MEFEIDLSENGMVSKYIDAAFYKRYFAEMPVEKQQSFANFCKRCMAEFKKEELERDEMQVLNFLLLRHYFML